MKRFDPRPFRGTVWLLLTSMFLLSASTFSAYGQATNTGTVAGQVTDPQGAVVPGVRITITNPTTGQSLSTTSNDQGRYVIVNVPPATYDIAATKTGFATAKVAAQTVQVGLTSTVDVKMTVGEVSTTVEVRASGVELQTMNATVGNTVSSVALNNLPSLGRDVSTFNTLQPGVSPDGSVAGAVVDQSTFQLDGGNNTNDMDGSMQVYTPSFAGDATGGVTAAMVGAPPTGVMPTPADSVEEFKVNTANQTADFNSSAGAQVQVVTRRGTNVWHGSGYEFYEDNNFNANTWQNNLNGVKNPDWHRSRFGAEIGGPIIPKKILGGKTYFFGFYQGFRWPNSTTIERPVPSANMRNGILSFTGTSCPSGTGSCTFNLNTLDPRGVGINPTVKALWNKFEPLPNDPGCSVVGVGSRCDTLNEQGFVANMAIPQSDNYGVARLDHDFSDKWHFFGSYRYYRLTRATADQIDIGGAFTGDTLGVPASLSNRPQVPWYYVAGLTTNINASTTNDFHYSMLRNWWLWGTHGDPLNVAGLGAALEPLGESTSALIPYNVNTQSTRTRFWDGIDNMFRDDITSLKGNHLFSFGGTYQRNHDKHQRTDNGGGINYYPVYQLGSSTTALDISSLGIPSNSTTKRDVAAVLGIVSASQVAYTRSGPNLTLNPPLTPANEDSIIPYYNVYFSDSWHMKPSFTLTYGLGWALEMPPVDKQGRQVELVDQSNRLVDVQTYINTKRNLALQGVAYDPIVGFSLVGNSENGRKYPYDPFYGGFSPRIAAAWNPDFHFLGGKGTVIRGGYSRIYGRLNGVDLVLVPLLGTGLIQPVQCLIVLTSGCGTGVTPTVANSGSNTAFRIGVDGPNAPLAVASPTLPQPLYPGVSNCSGTTCVPAGAGQGFDPHFRPNVVDSFDLTIQRQLSSKVTLEVGYIGRLINHEYQPVNINAVPYMFTMGGQQFQSAYANIEKALGCATSFNACGAAVPAPFTIAGSATGKTCTKGSAGCAANAAYGNYVNSLPSQPFFQSALASKYCTGSFSNGTGSYSNCTAAVVDNELSNFTTQSVWSLWSDLDNPTGSGPFIFPRTMLNTPVTAGGLPQLTSGVGVNGSFGHGNYNGGFVSVKMADWRGLSAQSNLTWGKALGTGAVVQASSSITPNDPFNLDNMYGYQNFDRKFIYNLFFVYQSPFFKGQTGILGRLLGGWSFSPLFTAGTGLPLFCNTFTDAQSFGAGDGVNFGENEQCLFSTKPGNGSASAYYGVAGSGGVGTSTAGNTTSSEINIFKDPAAVFNNARPPILGLDTHVGGFGNIRGLPYFNMDFNVSKDIKFTERIGVTFSTVFTNVLNHNQLVDPTLDPNSPDSWGVLGTQPNTAPRSMEFGLRIHF